MLVIIFRVNPTCTPVGQNGIGQQPPFEHSIRGPHSCKILATPQEKERLMLHCTALVKNSPGRLSSDAETADRWDRREASQLPDNRSQLAGNTSRLSSRRRNRTPKQSKTSFFAQ